MHRSLFRQLKRAADLSDENQLTGLVDEAARLSGQTGLSPELSSLLGNLGDFFTRVEASYDQSDRDLALRTRSLELSSKELTEVNTCISKELASRERAIDSLKKTVAGLLPNGQFSESSDVESLSTLVAQLVHERERDRQELSNQKFALDEHAIVSITDTQGKIIYANDRFCQISKYAREELLGQNHSIVKSGFHSKEFFGELWSTILAGKVWHGEVKNRAKDSEEYWVSATVVPFLDEHGMPYQFIAIRTDISARKAAEAAMAEAARAAEAASRAKSEFLANMSHEIRTPMNGIIGMTDLALDTPLNAEQREYLQIVKNSADSLLTIINDILDFSKIEAGRMDIESIPFASHSLVSETIKLLSMRAYQKGLELICDIDSNVPRSLLGDPGRIRQILTNLLGNALKFTPTGSITLRMRVDSREQQGDDEVINLHIAVQDTGIGIPVSKQRIIFEAFSQEDASTTRQYGGTGLGLTICNRLVGMMDGRMWVDSELGDGSTFHFIVCLKVDPNHTHIEPVGTEYLKNKRVLVVDDIETNRQILERQLSKYEMVVESLGSSTAALAYLQTTEQKFDLLLLDVQMPDMDGFMLVKSLRNQPPKAGVPPIIFLSSSGMKGDAQQCRDLAIAAYYAKPVLEDELIAGIQRVLSPKTSITTIAHEPVEQPLVTRHLVRESCRPLKVLLVEDHPVNQKLAVGLLNRWGHQSFVAADGQAGVDAFEAQTFDVILMDVQMPVMSGIEATQRIRAIESNSGKGRIPIIAMTANAMQGDREVCIDAGMDDYIAKPIKAKELQSMLEVLALELEKDA
ncbi:MAG: hypothetical protein RIR18_2392 [Pseudomonadota bacterium]|jgi:PAS domain S-box-containing protein